MSPRWWAIAGAEARREAQWSALLATGVGPGETLRAWRCRTCGLAAPHAPGSGVAERCPMCGSLDLAEEDETTRGAVLRDLGDGREWRAKGR